MYVPPPRLAFATTTRQPDVPSTQIDRTVHVMNVKAAVRTMLSSKVSASTPPSGEADCPVVEYLVECLTGAFRHGLKTDTAGAAVAPARPDGFVAFLRDCGSSELLRQSLDGLDSSGASSAKSANLWTRQVLGAGNMAACVGTMSAQAEQLETHFHQFGLLRCDDDVRTLQRWADALDNADTPYRSRPGSQSSRTTSPDTSTTQHVDRRSPQPWSASAPGTPLRRGSRATAEASADAAYDPSIGQIDEAVSPKQADVGASAVLDFVELSLPGQSLSGQAPAPPPPAASSPLRPKPKKKRGHQRSASLDPSKDLSKTAMVLPLAMQISKLSRVRVLEPQPAGAQGGGSRSAPNSPAAKQRLMSAASGGVYTAGGGDTSFRFSAAELPTVPLALPKLSQDLLTSSELEKENAHFDMTEALISAIEEASNADLNAKLFPMPSREELERMTSMEDELERMYGVFKLIFDIIRPFLTCCRALRRAGCYALPGAHACWLLIGDCDSSAWPIHVSRYSSPGWSINPAPPTTPDLASGPAPPTLLMPKPTPGTAASVSLRGLQNLLTTALDVDDSDDDLDALIAARDQLHREVKHSTPVGAGLPPSSLESGSSLEWRHASSHSEDSSAQLGSTVSLHSLASNVSGVSNGTSVTAVSCDVSVSAEWSNRSRVRLSRASTGPSIEPGGFSVDASTLSHAESTAMSFLQSLPQDMSTGVDPMDSFLSDGTRTINSSDDTVQKMANGNGNQHGMPTITFSDLVPSEESDTGWVDVDYSTALPDETKVQSRLRGDEEWAPPRRQIVFHLHAKAMTKKEALASQSHRCAGCGLSVDPSYVGRFRYCEYLGKYFCSSCHSKASCIIPSRVLWKWDFRKWPVSNFAKELIEMMLMETPLFHVEDINPALYPKVKNLALAKETRRQLSQVHRYLASCPSNPRVLKDFKSMPHVYEDIHLYSLEELIGIRDGAWLAFLQTRVDQGVRHIRSCMRCMAKGFVCELCGSNDVIFPFEDTIAMTCPECQGCFHKKCWARRKDDCVKCERVRKYRERIAK